MKFALFLKHCSYCKQKGMDISLTKTNSISPQPKHNFCLYKILDLYKRFPLLYNGRFALQLNLISFIIQSNDENSTLIDGKCT